MGEPRGGKGIHRNVFPLPLVREVFEKDFYSVNEELPRYQRFIKPYIELENKVDKLVTEGKIGRATGESIKLRSGVENS